MQVILDPDYIDLLRNEGESKPKHDGSEYSPFVGKKVPVVSMEDIKKLMSLPKDERQEMLLVLSNNVL